MTTPKDLGGLTMDKYLEATIIFALTDERNFLETYSTLENASKATLRANPTLLIFNLERSGRKLSPDEAKEILGKYDYVEILKKYHMV